MIRAAAGLGLGAATVLHAGPALAPVLPALGTRLPVVLRQDGEEGVALTFDAGPHPEGTPAVLETLRERGALATFFLAGEQVVQRPKLAAEIIEAGHRVALHCFRHRSFIRLSPREARADLTRGAAAIEDATGAAVTLFRPPFGYLTAAALSFARAQGWEVVLWKRIGYDWRPSATPERIARRATRGLRGGEIIVLHDADFYSSPGSWRATAAALPLVFERLDARELRAISL